MKLRYKILFSACCMLILCLKPAQSQAQFGIFGWLVAKVIKAADLAVQRVQTETVWLQEAEKNLENSMQQLHLNEITDWVQKQKDLYGQYFDELWKVKTIISDYDRIKEIVNREAQLVASYKQAWSMLSHDKHFTPDELNYMQSVYTGLINESVQNLNQLSLVINAFVTQMSDADRLTIINHAADGIDKNYGALLMFNNQNAMLSLQRARDADDVDMVKKMYGLP